MGGDGGGLAHPLDKEDRAEREADDDGFGQVAEDRQEECGGEDCRLSPTGPDENGDGRLLDHVPGDDGEDTRKSGKRNIGGKRRGHSHEEQDEQRVQHARDRTMRARAHIGCGPRDGASDAETAEERRSEIGRALCDKLAVRAVPTPGHAVGDHRGEKRLDGAQKREGDCGGQNRHDLVERQVRQAGRRQGRGNAAELRTDCLHRQVQECRCQGRGADCNQHARPMRPPFAQAEDDRDRRHRDEKRVRRQARTRLPQGGELLQQLARLMVERQAKKFLDLAGKDDDRDPGGEADRHREGNELDEGAEAQEADGRQHQAREEGCKDQPLYPVLRHRRSDQHDEGARGPADLEPRSAQKRDEEAADDGRVEPLRRGCARGDGDRHREGQGDDGNR